MPLLRPITRSTALLLGMAMLVSCTSAPPVDAPAAASIQRASPPAVPASPLLAKVYRIDPAASTLHILVYRGGAMARLGHNHVVSSPNLQGSVWQGASLDSAGFDITVPVNDLIVDDNATRAAEGEDFAQNVSEDAKLGTKTNMLRDTQLDGARYPDIRITSIRVQGDATAPVVIAALRIKDQTREVTLPVALQTSGKRLQVQGKFEIRQTDFGITPLSIALGALQVVDTLTIKFALVAVAD